MLKTLSAVAAVLLMAAPTWASAASPSAAFSPSYATPLAATSPLKGAPMISSGQSGLIAPGGATMRCRYQPTKDPYYVYNPCTGRTASTIH